MYKGAGKWIFGFVVVCVLTAIPPLTGMMVDKNGMRGNGTLADIGLLFACCFLFVFGIIGFISVYQRMKTYVDPLAPPAQEQKENTETAND